jgi:hypothetical protein
MLGRERECCIGEIREREREREREKGMRRNSVIGASLTRK